MIDDPRLWPGSCDGAKPAASEQRGQYSATFGSFRPEHGLFNQLLTAPNEKSD